MGSRGASSSQDKASFKNGLKLSDGTEYEFDGTLQYGGKDKYLTGATRGVVEVWEANRIKNKIEYAYAVREDGRAIGETKGGKKSVSVPSWYHTTQNSVFTHIHPRDDKALLGGTFSKQDLSNFYRYNNKTMRAVAREGTYSISKGKNFDANGFSQMITQADKAFSTNYKTAMNTLNKKFMEGSIDYSNYSKMSSKAFNTALVNLHNEYKKNAKKYGYTYTLERR